MHCEYPHFAPLYGSNPQRVVDKCVDIVDNDGFILVSTIFYWAPTCEGLPFIILLTKRLTFMLVGYPIG